LISQLFSLVESEIILIAGEGNGHPAPKASHKKTPPKRGLVVEKTGDTQVAIRLDRAKRSKGSKGSDQWMPAINSCSYAQRWDRLIEKYELEANNIGISARVEACQQITKRQGFSF